MNYNYAYQYCGGSFTYITGNPYRFNIMDIRKSCVNFPSCYDYTNFANFLNKDDALNQLNVKGKTFNGCNSYTQEKLLSMDYFLDYRRGLENLLSNDIPVFMYYGNKDFVCPVSGGLKVAESLSWKGKDSFVKETMKDILANGNKVGQFKQYGALYFASVFDAGHRVPYDQPEWTFNFLKDVVLSYKTSMIVN